MVDIAVIAGDGIGPEVVREGLKVLDMVSKHFGLEVHLTEYPFGADHYLKTGETMPASMIAELRQYDAILLGAIGDPRVPVGLLERAIIGKSRFELDLYVNLRPVKCFSDFLCPLKGKTKEDIDMVVIRENTEGAYTLIGGFLKKGTPDEVAMTEMVYTRKGTERIIRYAFELAKKQGRKKVTMVDKANAILAHDLWTRTFAEVGAEYPDIEKDHAYVDAACMWMVKNPEHFEVIVATNLFGDILTDLGAILQGGMGIAAGGNINPAGVGMFEPIHGSAPKYAGKNVANPLATVCAVGMMMEHIGRNDIGRVVNGAVETLLASGKIKDISTSSGIKTTEYGDMVRAQIKSSLAMAR